MSSPTNHHQLGSKRPRGVEDDGHNDEELEDSEQIMNVEYPNHRAASPCSATATAAAAGGEDVARSVSPRLCKIPRTPSAEEREREEQALLDQEGGMVEGLHEKKKMEIDADTMLRDEAAGTKLFAATASLTVNASATPSDKTEKYLPLAPTLEDFMSANGTRRYRPRPCWISQHPQEMQRLEPQQQQQRSQNVEGGGLRPFADEFHADDLAAASLVADDEPPPVAAGAGVGAAAVNNVQRAPEDGLLPMGAFQDFSAHHSNGEDTMGDGSAAIRMVWPGRPLGPDHGAGTGGAAAGAANHDNPDATPSLAHLRRHSSAPHAPAPQSLFGREHDCALHVTVRHDATEAALVLLDHGTLPDVVNAKGVTPLILAAQRGNLVLCTELLRRGANPASMANSGATPLMQAAHFGHPAVVELLLNHHCTYSEILSHRGRAVQDYLRHLPVANLMEIANVNHTTALMRAAQEGQLEVVRLLLRRGAQVNRRNREQMTALMLAAQRGNDRVCHALVQHAAELDAVTTQNSTALMLACKRGKVVAAKVLVTAGAELWVQDSRGRTARDMARRLQRLHPEASTQLLEMLDSAVQVRLMQEDGRRQRNFEMMRLWTLLQQERAVVLICDMGGEEGMLTLFAATEEIKRGEEMAGYGCCYDMRWSSGTAALVRTMTLPAPLMQHVAEYLPLPLMWTRRTCMLTRRAMKNADATVAGALDLIDETLDEGGFLDACDIAQVTPPTNYASWAEFRAFCRQHGSVAAEMCPSNDATGLGNHPAVANVTTAELPGPRDPKAPTLIELRRQAGFLQLLANRTTLLTRVLAGSPYMLPQLVIQQLITSSDVASLARRMGSQGVHFDARVAMDLVLLASRLCDWVYQQRAPETRFLSRECRGEQIYQHR